jgi:hypothetical protein
MGQNETKRHFELRNLDKDMQDAHTKASHVISKREARAISYGNTFVAVFIVILIGVLLYLFGIF